MKILDMSEVYKNPEWSMEREEKKSRRNDARRGL